ncbi:translation initiation factor IF-2-like isoform X1 [Onychostruthus taczanowskii]|uniref:translation initiation factor IF-2-like isoform X1 n=1 Tax=Onychostruthus taczanowskii TaxID=356909 RepID=UPI001B7FF5AE|nr:translation initiation factor IF-2-like isoform X1 [Onychostruthus taczanowskii]
MDAICPRALPLPPLQPAHLRRYLPPPRSALPPPAAAGPHTPPPPVRRPRRGPRQQVPTSAAAAREGRGGAREEEEGELGGGAARSQPPRVPAEETLTPCSAPLRTPPRRTAGCAQPARSTADGQIARIVFIFRRMPLVVDFFLLPPKFL